MAIAIAKGAAHRGMMVLSIHSHPPASVCVYNLPKGYFWYILFSHGDAKDGVILRSSKLIVVSKADGEILYNGSANDEG